LLEARGPNEFDGAFAAMAKERVGALLVLSDVMLNSHRTRLADLAARNRLPAVYGVRESVEVGGLMSYGPSFLDLYRRAATYVDKILKGAKPAELPVERPTKFELVINMKTAKALGLTRPQSVLLRADEVIQKAGIMPAARFRRASNSTLRRPMGPGCPPWPLSAAFGAQTKAQWLEARSHPHECC